MSRNEPGSDSLRRVISLLGNKFGGAWYEGDRLHVAVHDLTVSEEAAVKGVLGPDVAVQATSLPLDRGQAYVELISSLMESQGIDFDAVRLDVKAARVVIKTSADPARIGVLVAGAGIPTALVFVTPADGTWGAIGPIGPQ